MALYYGGVCGTRGRCDITVLQLQTGNITCMMQKYLDVPRLSEKMNVCFCLLSVCHLDRPASSEVNYDRKQLPVDICDCNGTLGEDSPPRSAQNALKVGLMGERLNLFTPKRFRKLRWFLDLRHTDALWET